MKDKFYYSDGTTSTTNRDYNKTLHREDGPAIETSDGYKSWYLNGIRHRTDGPAVEFLDGIKAWYIDNRYIKVLTYNQLIVYCKHNNYTCAHLLTDNDSTIRRSIKVVEEKGQLRQLLEQLDK